MGARSYRRANFSAAIALQDEMLGSVRDQAGGSWCVLVMDAVTTKVLSNVAGVSDVMDYGVSCEWLGLLQSLVGSATGSCSQAVHMAGPNSAAREAKESAAVCRPEFSRHFRHLVPLDLHCSQFLMCRLHAGFAANSGAPRLRACPCSPHGTPSSGTPHSLTLLAGPPSSLPNHTTAAVSPQWSRTSTSGASRCRSLWASISSHPAMPRCASLFATSAWHPCRSTRQRMSSSLRGPLASSWPPSASAPTLCRACAR